MEQVSVGYVYFDMNRAKQNEVVNPKNSYLGIVYKIICSHINIYTLLGLSLPICISWYSPNFGIDHLYPIVSL